jgi:hypothetical protein
VSKYYYGGSEKYHGFEVVQNFDLVFAYFLYAAENGDINGQFYIAKPFFYLY